MLPRTVRAHALSPRATQLHRVLAPACTVRRNFASPPNAPPVELKKTPLYDFHVSHGAKMIPFGGYLMPLTYASEGLPESHNQVRSKAGLFDVSHMVQHRFRGPGALEFLQLLTPSDLTALKLREGTLSCLLHPVTGGVVDDVIITLFAPEDFYVVTNAATVDKDLAYFRENLQSFAKKAGVEHVVLKNRGLLALQGPEARIVLHEFLVRALGETKAPDLNRLAFYSSLSVEVPRYGEIYIARLGYTGEDGFEISVPGEKTESLAKEFLEIGKIGDRVKLAGLGPRDSLRLEAGFCLYGSDLDDCTTPIEAGLKWLVQKKRVVEGGFHGHETISKQYNSWSMVPRRRVGFTVEKGAPAREGAEIIDPATEEVIGKITSGSPSPTLGINIAIGYVKSGFHKSGTELVVKVRGKPRKATITKLPFVQTKFWKLQDSEGAERK